MPRLHREKLRLLVEQIVNGEFPPGAMLPREVDLQAHLDVSRGVVREIIRALEERGLVSVKHGRGATVEPVERWNVLDPLVLEGLLPGPDGRRVLLELTECRALLEVGAARLAAARADGGALDEIAAAVDRLGAMPRRSHAERGRSEIAIHRMIVQAAGNSVMARMLLPVLDATAFAADVLGRRSQSVDEHRRIATALREQDPNSAADSMAEHFSALVEDVRDCRRVLLRR
jgi:DNA-binding FadR family transcriptional regulator